ncbi:hypothetical protein CR513_61205, partial [Mucuna pruriens]
MAIDSSNSEPQFLAHVFYTLTPMVFKHFYELSCGVVEMAWIMLSVDYSRLLWQLFGVFSYENHEWKPRII